MKSKITKIQKIILKGIAILSAIMMSITPMAYAVSSLNDSYLQTSLISRLLYGKVGSTAKEIEEYFKTNTTLYISNEVQLRALAEYVNSSDEHTCKNKVIVLANDIVINNNVDWVPIGANIITQSDVNANGNNTIGNLPEIAPTGDNGLAPTGSELAPTGANVDITDTGDEGQPISEDDEPEVIIEDNSEGSSQDITPEEQEILDEDSISNIVNIFEEENEYNSVSSKHVFEGTFDGNNCIISNLRITKNGKSYSELSNVGLFGNTGNSAIIKNVRVKDFNIDITYEGKDLTATSSQPSISILYGGAGNIVGYNKGLVENCTTEGCSVIGGKNVGGIAGFNTGIIRNCTNTSRVRGAKTVGGIAGASDNEDNTTTKAVIENCKNTGMIYGRFSEIGGIVGTSRNKTSIKSSYNTGTVCTDQIDPAQDIAKISGYQIEVPHAYVGGILGRANQMKKENGNYTRVHKASDAYGYTVIENCINDAKVYGYSEIGGIAGEIDGVKLTDCINNGEISGTNHIGGIIGYAYNTEILRASNSATIEATGANVGGIAGKLNEYSKVQNSYTLLAKDRYIKGKGNVGGIVGKTYGHDTSSNGQNTIKNNYVSAFIRGNVTIGGIVGQANYTNISNCWFQDRNGSTRNKFETFDVAGYQTVGGIVGWAVDSNVKNCVNTGEPIAVYRKVGGIVGASYDSIIENNDSLGEVYLDVYHWTTNNETGKSTYEYDNNPIIKSATVDSKAEPMIAGGIVGYVVNNEGKSSQIKGNIVGQAQTVGGSYVGGIVGHIVNNDTDATKITIFNNKREKTESQTNNTVEAVSAMTYKNVTYKGSDNKTHSALLKNISYLDSSKNDKIVTGDLQTINQNCKANYVGRIYGSYNKKLYGTEGAPKYQEQNNKPTLDTISISSTEAQVRNGIKLIKGDGQVFNITNTRNATYISDIDNSVGQVGSSLKSSDIGVVNNTSNKTTIGDNLNVEFKLYKTRSTETNKTEITSETYLKGGDILTVEAKFDKYLASAYGPITKIGNDILKLKLNNTKETTGTVVDDATNYKTTITYTYTVQDGDEFDVNTLNLSKNGNIYVLSGNDFATNHPTMGEINNEVTVSGIHIDTVAPKVKTTAYVENALINGRYTAGKEVLIEAVTDEQILANTKGMPIIQVNFTESGKGKYNYDGTNNSSVIVGHAKPLGAYVLVDGRTVWLYSYQIQEGDNGNIQLQYIRDDENHTNVIADKAGNGTDLSIYAQSMSINNSESDVNLNSKLTGNNVGNNAVVDKNVTYKIYKGEGNSKTEIKGNTYINKTDKITVEAILDGFVYTEYTNGTNGNKSTFLTQSTAPKLEIDNIEANAAKVERSINPVSSVEQATYDDVKTVITYVLNGNQFNTTNVSKLNTLKLSPSTKIYMSNRYATKFASNGAGTEELYDIAQMNNVTVQIPTTASSNVDISGLNIYVDPIGVLELFDTADIYADTKKPTVEIIAKGVENNKTKNDTITYEFKWSEKVIGFTKDDITVNGGTKGEFSSEIENGDGTYSYKMNITNTVENGKEGNVQVIIEQDAAQDLVYQGNIRAENIIIVDKQAPILQSIEAFGTEGREYYKTGDTIEIVATFNENVEKTSTVPTLSLKFGDTERTANLGIIDGNKITYTYTIDDNDNGKLEIKDLSGIVKDAVGNETRVAKRILQGNTIIADTIKPTLVGLTAIVPEFEYDEFINEEIQDTVRYGTKSKTRDTNTITVIAEYNENITGIAPVLTLKFGDTDRTVNSGTINGNKITYTYSISTGDNENLIIKSLSGSVSDIAGNTSETNISLPDFTEYEAEIKEDNKIDNILVDTTSPRVSLKVKNIENTISGTDGNYKAGDIVTITATTDEFVYRNNNKELVYFTKENAPQLSIEFETEAGKGQVECTNVEYNNNNTIFTYEYIIESDDNGEISLSFNAEQCYDIALNGNDAGIKDNSSLKVVADTIIPNTSHLQGTYDNSYIKDNGDGTYSVLFTEKLYSLEDGTRKNLTTNNAPKLVLNDEGEYKTVNASAVGELDGGTVITYRYEKAGVTRVGIDGYDKVCDKAGNMYNDNVRTGLTISNIRITKPEDKTKTYGKDTEVEIIVTFNKRLTGTAPTLKLKFDEEDGTERTLTNGVIDKNTITYKYTIQSGDNGKLKIISINGNDLRSEDGIRYEAPETYSITGETIIADTIAPKASIIAYNPKWDFNNDNIIDSKDAAIIQQHIDDDDLKYDIDGDGVITVLDSTKLIRIIENLESKDIINNANKTKYFITWSEPVNEFTIDDIEVINGSKGTFTKISDKLYILEVDTLNEGRQLVKVNANVCTDVAGNINEERAIYNSVIIDKTAPIAFVTYVTNPDGSVTARLNFAGEDGIITNPTDGSPTHTFTQTGTFTFEFKDEAGNTGSKKAEAIIKTAPDPVNPPDEPVQDKTAPEITFYYTTLSSKVGTPIGSTIITNEDAKISYSWDNTNWSTTSDFVRSVNAVKTPNTSGTYTLYAKAEDKAGNISSISRLQFTVSDGGTVVNPEIEFEDLTVIQKNGVKYVKVSPTFTTSQLTSKMNVEKLLGQTPTYIKLTSDNKLRTGSEITLNGETKYIIIVNGDVNCDGKVDFINDIVMINNYRIREVTNLSEIQILAGDINNSGTIEFIPDIVAMNNYRLGNINVL